MAGQLGEPGRHGQMGSGSSEQPQILEIGADDKGVVGGEGTNNDCQPNEPLHIEH